MLKKSAYSRTFSLPSVKLFSLALAAKTHMKLPKYLIFLHIFTDSDQADTGRFAGNSRIKKLSWLLVRSKDLCKESTHVVHITQNKSAYKGSKTFEDVGNKCFIDGFREENVQEAINSKYIGNNERGAESNQQCENAPNNRIWSTESISYALSIFSNFVQQALVRSEQSLAFVVLDSWELRVQLPKEAAQEDFRLPLFLQFPKLFELRREVARWRRYHSLVHMENVGPLETICTVLDTYPQMPNIPPSISGDTSEHYSELQTLFYIFRVLLETSRTLESHPMVLLRPLDFMSDFDAFVLSEARILYLSNIPIDTSQYDLDLWFSSVDCVPASCWTFKTSSNQRGFCEDALVLFATHSEAKKALQLNGCKLKDNLVQVSPSSNKVFEAASDILVPLRQADSKPRLGDWLCGRCSFNNFQRRIVCLRCCFPAAVPVARQDFFTLRPVRLPYEDVLFRAGDWRCGNIRCGYHNFAKNLVCLRCGASRASAAVTAEGYWQQNARPKFQNLMDRGSIGCRQQRISLTQQAMAVPRPANYCGNNSNLSGLVKFDDWVCSCGFTNFQRRENCLRCSAPGPMLAEKMRHQMLVRTRQAPAAGVTMLKKPLNEDDVADTLTEIYRWKMRLSTKTPFHKSVQNDSD